MESLDKPTFGTLEVLVAPSGEIFCNGFNIGLTRNLGDCLTIKEEDR